MPSFADNYQELQEEECPILHRTADRCVPVRLTRGFGGVEPQHVEAVIRTLRKYIPTVLGTTRKDLEEIHLNLVRGLRVDVFAVDAVLFRSALTQHNIDIEILWEPSPDATKILKALKKRPDLLDEFRRAIASGMVDELPL